MARRSLRSESDTPAVELVDQGRHPIQVEAEGSDDTTVDLEQLCSAGLLVEQKGKLYLTRKGRFMLISSLAVRKPTWDESRHLLLWGTRLLKRLRREAETQRAVLAAFEAVGWTERIDDPLEAEPDLDAKERLRETVKRLNRGLAEGTIRFHTDGTGRGVRWKVVS